MPRVLLEAVVEAPFGPLRVMTTHLEYYSAAQRAAQVEALRAHHAEAVRPRAPATGRMTPATRAVPQPPAGRRGDPDRRLQLPSGRSAARAHAAPFDDADVPPLDDAWERLRPGQPHAHTSGVHDREQWPESFACDFVFATRDLQRAPARDRGRRGDPGLGPPADPARTRRRLTRRTVHPVPAARPWKGCRHFNTVPHADPPRALSLRSFSAASSPRLRPMRPVSSSMSASSTAASGGRCRPIATAASSTSPAGPATAMRCSMTNRSGGARARRAVGRRHQRDQRRDRGGRPDRLRARAVRQRRDHRLAQEHDRGSGVLLHCAAPIRTRRAPTGPTTSA